MTIPFQKVALTTVRYLMRPINNTINRKFKTLDKDRFGYRFFKEFGQYANVFEIKLNRAMIGAKGLSTIQRLDDDIAFNKGVEWFTEVFIFYGILIAIAGYEINKSVASAQKTKQNIQELVKESLI